MTKNQIEYAKLLETERANRATENLTQWRDQQTVAHNARVLQETGRHNLATEALGSSQLEEAKRSNLERERQNLMLLSEQQRHNVAVELETNRANVARETEDVRYHTLSLDETHRSNVAREQETHRTNVANEGIKRDTLSEQQRANLASEDIRRVSNAISAAQVNELGRANRAREIETNRTNVAHELLQSGINRETRRHNTAEERLSSRRNELQAGANRIASWNAASNRQQAAVATERQKVDETRASFQNFNSIATGLRDLTSSARNVYDILKW